MSEEQYPPDDAVERHIIDYLRTHPHFFNRHPETLETLRIPHPCRPAVSLIERQLMLLRQQNVQLRRKLRDLVKIARDNDCLSSRMQQLNLVLIESNRLDDMLAGIQCVLREEFNADFTSLKLLTLSGLLPDRVGDAAVLNPASVPAFAPVFDTGRPICGRLTSQQLEHLFDDAAAHVASAALVPLSGFEWQGLIAIGSRDPKRFHVGMGTLFLSRIGELISHALQLHLNVSESA